MRSSQNKRAKVKENKIRDSNKVIILEKTIKDQVMITDLKKESIREVFHFYKEPLKRIQNRKYNY